MGLGLTIANPAQVRVFLPSGQCGAGVVLRWAAASVEASGASGVGGPGRRGWLRWNGGRRRAAEFRAERLQVRRAASPSGRELSSKLAGDGGALSIRMGRAAWRRSPCRRGLTVVEVDPRAAGDRRRSRGTRRRCSRWWFRVLVAEGVPSTAGGAGAEGDGLQELHHGARGGDGDHFGDLGCGHRAAGGRPARLHLADVGG